MISISIQFEQNQDNTFEMWIMMFLTHSFSKQTILSIYFHYTINIISVYILS